MKPEFSGIERRLDELNERLARLRPLREKARVEFDSDPYLRDIVERNLEIAAQCCIDICNRIIALEGATKPRDYYEAILRQGENWACFLPRSPNTLHRWLAFGTYSRTSIWVSTGMRCMSTCSR